MVHALNREVVTVSYPSSHKAGSGFELCCASNYAQSQTRPAATTRLGR